MMRRVFLAALLIAAALSSAQDAIQHPVTWRYLSTVTGDLSIPNHATEQTSLTAGDFGYDGHLSFVVTERTSPDSVVLYRHIGDTWIRSVIEPQPLHIKANGVAIKVWTATAISTSSRRATIKSNEIWWRRNPSPHILTLSPSAPIKPGGSFPNQSVYLG